MRQSNINDRAQRAFDFFVSKGWSPAQAAGIVGNGQAESGKGLNERAVGDSGAALGIFQWNDRRPKLIQWAKNNGRDHLDFDTQLEFAQHELETSESYAASRLRAATTVDEAAAAFMHFERPSGYSRNNPTAGHNWAGRLANAKAIFGGNMSYPQIDRGNIPRESVSSTPNGDKVSFDNPISPRAVTTDVEMNQFNAQQAAQAPAFDSKWDAFKAAREDESMINWMMKGRTDLLPDPNWQPTPDILNAAKAGVPEQFWPQLGKAHSQAHLEQIKEGILADVDYEKKMEGLGWTGTGLRVGASLTTIDNLALLLLAPEVSLPKYGGMLAKVGIKAAEGAFINTLTEIPRVAYKPSANGTDLLWAAGTGAALGGAFGAFAKNPALAQESAEYIRIGKSLQAHAEEELKAGTMLRSVDLPGSAGAARVSSRDVLTDAGEDWLHGAVDNAIERSWASRIRWDVAGKGKASENPATRAFTSHAVVDVVGNADKTKVSHIAAEEWQKQLDFDFSMRAEQGHVQHFNEFMTSRGITGAGKDEAEVEFKKLVTNYLDNVRPEKEWDAAVKKQGDLIRKSYADYLEYLKNPGLLDGSERRAVAGFENVDRAPYRPNIADHQKIDAHSVRYGDDTMREFVAQAFLRKVPELGEELARRMGKGYWRTLREATAGMSNLDRVLHGNDMEALKKALQDIDLSDADIQKVISVAKPKPSKEGGTARSKRKALYDNNFEMMVRNKSTGEMEKLRMADLFQDDYLYGFKSYSRQMSGQIGMAMMRIKNPLYSADNPHAAEFLVDGITSRGEFDKFVREMRSVWDAKTHIPHADRMKAANADEARLQFIYDRITGTPDQTKFPNLAKWARAVHGYNYTRVMNQVGLAQLGEMLGVGTQIGLKAALEGMPSFRAMLRDAKTGQLQTSFAREMEELSGFGADWFRDGFRHHLDDMGEMINRSANGQRWNKVDDLLHTGKRITNVVSGMSTVDTFSRRWASAAAVMKIVNAAAKTAEGGSVKGLNMNRMRALGLDDDMAHRVFAQIRKHADFEDGAISSRKYLAGNFGKWDDQEALSHFRTAVWRWSRMVIQDNVVGQGNVMLSHPMARTILQFRNFMMNAWTNQLLRNLHHMDFNTFASFMTTSVVGGMVYTAQQYLNSTGRSDQKDYLEEKLSPSGIAKAMVQRGEWSSIMPTIIDTGLYVTSFKPWFEDRASGLASNAFSNPTFDLASTGLKASHGIGRAIRQGGWSQSEIRALQRIMPFQNVIGVQPLVNSLIRHQPERTRSSSW
ncbi:phage tail tip lysozyme [Rhizobium lemnae]|uniref:Phage tail tip lysozyme n=1 Tax=Rhizobium lemnae TaxID=1214924 RepID=A0ABV8E4B0_9HYPH|nr:phage tail tip lysozyme [Rhizobium lemnae]MCJ8507947.1 phage tail tip lysozyme [Rhizobium lemnae]